jgi:hypothetical protein
MQSFTENTICEADMEEAEESMTPQQLSHLKRKAGTSKAQEKNLNQAF